MNTKKRILLWIVCLASAVVLYAAFSYIDSEVVLNRTTVERLAITRGRQIDDINTKLAAQNVKLDEILGKLNAGK